MLTLEEGIRDLGGRREGGGRKRGAGRGDGGKQRKKAGDTFGLQGLELGAGNTVETEESDRPFLNRTPLAFQGKLILY